MEQKKKQLKQESQQQTPRMGIWQVRNLVNDRVLIGASPNLPGMINRLQFQLKMGSHQNTELQADWNRYGSDSFAFEILDELTPNADPQHDHRADLAFLEELWLEKLQPYDERGYNERKLSREERLRLIASRRSPGGPE